MVQGLEALGVFQAGGGGGIPDPDDGSFPERGVTVPWTSDPINSWLDYRCWIETYLDAGMALHKPLPQTLQRGSPTLPRAAGVDTLASGFIDDNDLDSNTEGVNLVSGGNYRDFVQRMATSTYRFRLRGHGLRAGFQIAIPGLVSVAGVKATPAESQFATNVVVGNMGGIPIWFARWDLWYFVTLPPNKAQVPPPNLAEHIRGDVQLARSIAIPQSQPDQNASRVLPPRRPEGRVPNR